MEAAAEIESDSHLDDVLDEVSGHLNAQHARLVDAAVVMLANRRWWSGEGVEQPQQYLAWRTALSPQRARQVVTVAERAAELPTCMGRFRAGELAIDQMAAIAKRAPWWTDTQIAGIAARLTVAQLRRVLARYPFPLIPKPDAPDTGEDDADTGEDEPADAAAADAAGDDTDTDTETDAGDDTDDDTDAVTGAEADDCGSVDGRPERDPAAGRARPESLWFGWDDDGRFRMNLDADADTGLIVEHALRHARDRLYRNHNDDRRDRVDWIDALRDVAQRALTHTDDADDSGGGGGRSDPFRINLHLDTDTNLTDHNGRWLPDSIRQHISCDGLLSPVFYRDAVPMAVGRTQRVIPARIRRQVIHRDSGVCRVPGCGCDMVVEIHHIIHWEHGGVTETWNLISLCPQHHRLHHQGRLGITGNADLPDGVTFTNRHGRIIATSGAEPTLPEAPPPSPTGTYQHPLGERLDTWYLDFHEPKPGDTTRQPHAAA